MKTVRFSLTCHWGFTVKSPAVSKAQPAVKMPPPSSLIGAICMPLAKKMGLGEVIYDGVYTKSAVASFAQMFRAAAARLKDFSRYWQDINRSLILQFQQPARRGVEKYMFGAIPTGKVYAPNVQFDVALLLEERYAEQQLGSSWDKEIKLAVLQISRLGSKESIAHSTAPFIVDVKPTISDVETSYYFPLRAATPVGTHVDQPYHHEEFWEPEWTFGVEAKRVIYVVPGLSSFHPCEKPITVRPKWTAYVGDDVTLFAESG